jgi:hypothetical protein
MLFARWINASAAWGRTNNFPRRNRQRSIRLNACDKPDNDNQNKFILVTKIFSLVQETICNSHVGASDLEIDNSALWNDLIICRFSHGILSEVRKIFAGRRPRFGKD